MIEFLESIDVILMSYFFLMGTWYGIMLLTAYPEVFSSYLKARYTNAAAILQHCQHLPISIIIPAYNEEYKILNTIYSILQSDYKNLEIIIVNDASTDQTLTVLTKEFSLYKIPEIASAKIKTAQVKSYYKSKKFVNLTVIDKEENRLKTAADAVNCGLNAVTTPLFFTIDADTIIEPNTLTNILLRFMSKVDCVTVGGAIYVLNGNRVEHGKLLTSTIAKKYIPAFQAIEYIRSFNHGRSGMNAFGGSVCNAGAFTLNETETVRKLGGYDRFNFAYDLEMTLALHDYVRIKHHPSKVYFASNALSWTIVPNTLKAFWLQRVRWHRGMMYSTLKHIRMLFNPRYGVTGMVTFPTFIAFELLAPIIEMVAYIFLIIALALDLTSWSQLIWFAFLAWGYILSLTITSAYLDFISFRKFDRLTNWRMLWLVTIEFFGFRQFRSAASTWGAIYFLINKIRGKLL